MPTFTQNSLTIYTVCELRTCGKYVPSTYMGYTYITPMLQLGHWRSARAVAAAQYVTHTSN